MSPPGRRMLLWAAAAAALWPAAAAAQLEWLRRPALLSPCETTLVDAGRPAARWALVHGVHEDERDRRGRDWVWTGRRWHARLLLDSPAERTVSLVGRRGPLDRQSLRLFWNGVDLGEREVDTGRATVSWTAAAGIPRAGLNWLRFEASQARELHRQLSFKLDRLEIAPGGEDCGPVETAPSDSAFTLAPGAILLFQQPLPPAAVLELEIDGEPGATLELHLSRDGEPQRRMELEVDRRRQRAVPVGDLLSNETVLVARGPGTATVRLAGISGDERPAAWRVACGLWWREPLALAALLALLAAAVVAGRRWPAGRGAPWLDGALLFGFGLALRFAWLEAYPEIDPNRFGDSWEYLQRSRYLQHGASFWSDTSWHAWQTWIRPPGYYVFLAWVRGLIGGELSILANVQAILLSGGAVASYQIAYPLFGRGAALAAGLLFAVYPQTITSAGWILSDPLSLFLTTSALALVSWAAVRRSWPLALTAGALVGVACLVRSAPLYWVPLAALLLWLGQRPPRRRAPAVVLAAAALVVVLPWCVRNSMIYGKPMGIDDLMIPNFLMAHPDPEILPAELEESGVWGEADEVRDKYFRALWRGNKAARLTLDSGRILGRGLLRMAASPGTTLSRFGLHLQIYFQPFPRFYSEHFLGETDGCHITAWTDALNAVYLLSLLLAIPGAVLALRRRESWPLLAWVLFFVVVTNLFFYPSYMPGRYRLPIYPALAVFAGLALSRTAELVAGRLSRRRRPAGDA